MTHSGTPVILLAFANDDGRSLRQLDEEQRVIKQILEPGRKERKFEVQVLPAATAEDVIRTFQEYRGRICLFHYGGHSNQDEIFFKKSFQDQEAVRVDNLADFLALQEGLELLFLNSCLSLGQAKVYHDAGTKAVIATSQSIKDNAARQFADFFYRALVTGASIDQAFQEAQKSMDIQLGGSDRGILLRSETESDQFPWQVFPPQLHTWRLPLVAKRLTCIPSIDLKKEFLGREADMQLLKEKLENTSKVVLMNGLGGIGKTVLATAYVQQYGGNYDHLAWINRGEDLIESIALNEYLADNLGLPFEQEEELEARFRRILRKLHQLSGRNLLIIDNAQEQVAQKGVYDHLPGSSNWHVLLTSRLDLAGFDRMRMDTLNPDASKALFRTHFSGPHTEAELQALLEEIGYHTLTIELLAKLLDKLNNLLSASELTAILQQKQLNDPDLQDKIWTNHSGEERGIYLHLIKAFKLTRLTKREKWLLKQFVVLPVERYAVVTLAELLQEKPLGLNKVLNSLAGKGWLTLHENKTFSIHRLIKQTVEYQLQPSFQDVEALIGSLIQKLAVDAYTSRIKNAYWISYATTVANSFTAVEHEQIASLYSDIAKTYWALGRYTEALRYHQKVLAIREAVLEVNHPDLATSYNDIAETYWALGQNEEALGYNQKALDIREAVLEANPLDLATSYHNIAQIYRNLRQYAEALGYNQKAIAILEAILEASHPDLAISYHNIAQTYRDLGQYAKALDYHQKAIAILEEVLEANHPKLATSYDVIASTYRDLGQYAKALGYQQKGLEIQEEGLEINYPNLATSYNNIASTYRDLGQYAEALGYNQKALDIKEAVLEANHPDLATSYNNFATTYLDLGQYEEALDYQQKALEIWELVLEANHPHLAASYNNTAVTYNALGQYTEALDYLQKALTIRESTLEASHPHLAASYNNTAAIYNTLGQYAEALDYLQKALTIREAVLDANHPHLANTNHNIGVAYCGLEKLEKALEFLHKAIRIRESSESKDQKKLAESYSTIADALRALGKINEAEEYSAKAAAINVKIKK